MLMPPTGDTSIEPVEDQGRRRKSRSSEEIFQRWAAHVEHAAQDGCETAPRIDQRQHVGQVELTDHREVFLRRGHGGENLRVMPVMPRNVQVGMWRWDP
jgi:hypothetical protein